jgi:hypothetical protein
MIIIGGLTQNLVFAQINNHNVLSKIIDYEYSKMPYKYIIVADSTVFDKASIIELKSIDFGKIQFVIKSKFGQLEWQKFVNSLQNNQAKFGISSNLIAAKTPVRIIKYNRNTIQNYDLAWPQTSSNPNKLRTQAIGILLFSPVFFSQNKQMALCLVNTLNPHDGEVSVYYLLEKRNDNWMVIHKALLKMVAYEQ